MTVQQTMSISQAAPKETPKDRTYVPPHWVDTEFGVQVLEPGHWVDAANDPEY